MTEMWKRLGYFWEYPLPIFFAERDLHVSEVSAISDRPDPTFLGSSDLLRRRSEHRPTRRRLLSFPDQPSTADYHRKPGIEDTRIDESLPGHCLRFRPPPTTKLVRFCSSLPLEHPCGFRSSRHRVDFDESSLEVSKNLSRQ